MLGALFAVLLPGRCAVCARPGHALCAACRAAFVRLHEPLCERCGSPGPWPVRRCAECAGRRIAFARARAAVVYDERARRFVREWKEHGRRRLADEAAAIVADVVPSPGGTVASDVRPRRSGTRLEARRRRPAWARTRSRRDLGAPGPRRPPAHRRPAAPARAHARGSAAERARHGRGDGSVASRRLPRRRRVHVRGDRRRLRLRAPQGGRDACRGGNAREGGSLDCSRGHRLP